MAYATAYQANSGQELVATHCTTQCNRNRNRQSTPRPLVVNTQIEEILNFCYIVNVGSRSQDTMQEQHFSGFPTKPRFIGWPTSLRW